MAQQLVARIKRTSKYVHQAPKEIDGGWFDIHVCPDIGGHSIEGNHNRYRFCDVALGLRLDNGDILKLP
jgi:hypothetical protein